MTLNLLSLVCAVAVRQLGNHLWQSTLFAGVVALIALALRKHQARVRYWLWVVASAKFLTPLALLIAVGSHLAKPSHSTETRTGIVAAVDKMSQPFTDITAFDTPTISPATKPAAPRPPMALLPVLIGVAWLCGFITVLVYWCVQWRRIAKVVEEAQPLLVGREIEVLRRMERTAKIPRQIAMLSSRDSMEPGVCGVAHPILLWPEGISQHLDDAHLEAILAHEVCHVQRRDNLTSVVHMLVEAIFWFHPLVWWMERRLVEERERACDESVLEVCSRPQVYAESLLKVCEFCVESPLACISGITGADLKRRISQIMTASIARKLGFGARLLLVASGLAAISVPIMLGQIKGARVVAAVKASERVEARAVSFAARLASPIELEPSTPSNTLLALPPVREFQLQEPVELAQIEAAQTVKQPKLLTNADVIEMSRAGVPESTILLTIITKPVRFDVSAEGILALHAAGITEPVMNKMIRVALLQKQSGGPSFGVATGTFPVKDASGKTVRFSAWIKTENVQNGYAGLWWRVDGPGEGNNRTQLAFDNSMVRFIDGKPDTGNGTVRGATGTTPWTLYEFELPVGKTASNINFGVLFSGTGTAWVDSMKVELDGEPYSNPRLDFDFESPNATGFYTGCGGSAGCTDYKVGIDDTTSYYGHQSLKMQFVGDKVTQK